MRECIVCGASGQLVAATRFTADHVGYCDTCAAHVEFYSGGVPLEEMEASGLLTALYGSPLHSFGGFQAGDPCFIWVDGEKVSGRVVRVVWNMARVRTYDGRVLSSVVSRLEPVVSDGWRESSW